MAEVFVARQKGMDGFDRMVAIKRILPHLLDDKSFVRMFQDEARLAARLSHPNVIHIYDFGKVEEHFFIAMEYMHSVHAGDLIRLATDTKMPAALVARIGANACAGLHYAHNRKDAKGNELQLVHRDVSPPNLLVSYDGVVKLVDFGIAKAVSSIEQTRPGVVKGKYAFMSPEQTMGQKLNGRSDVFSLGLVLWELLAGKNAVTRDDQILAMQTIRDGKVPPIQSVREDVPKALADALGNALKKSPAKRSDARQFGKELETFIKSSQEIATSMELGAWLTEHLPPKPIMSVDEEGEGTKPATAATGLQPLLDVLPEGAALPHPAEARARGSVVSKLLGEATVSDLSGAVKGDLSDEDPTPQSRSDSKRESDSVVVAREVIEGAFADQETRDIRPPSGSALAQPAGPIADVATTIDERGLQTRAPHLDEMDEPTNDLAAPTVEDQGPPASIPPMAPMPQPAGPPNSLFVDAEPSIAPAQPTPTVPALPTPVHSNQPRLLQLAPWFAGAFVLTALLVIASIGNGEEGKASPGVEEGEQPIVFDPDEAEAYRRDGSSGMPPIVVTPLPDAGAPPEDIVPEASPSVAPETPKKDRRRRRRSDDRKSRGSLEARTRPNSDVLYRGAKLGRTPLRNLPLQAGRYELTFVSKGLAPVKRKIVIRAGETTRLNFNLKD
jgi:serine/threonine-protein kinase